MVFQFHLCTPAYIMRSEFTHEVAMKTIFLVVNSLLISLKFRLSILSLQLTTFQIAEPRKTNESLMNLPLHLGMKATS